MKRNEFQIEVPLSHIEISFNFILILLIFAIETCE